MTPPASMPLAPTPLASTPITRRQGLVRGMAGGLVCGLAGLLPPLPARGEPVQHLRHFLFGSPVDLLLPPAAPAAAGSAVMQRLQAIHTRWNAWKPGEVSTLNRAFREGRAVAVSPSLQALIRQSAAYEQASFGLFNAGLGGAVGAWGFHDDVLVPGVRPPDRELARWRRVPPSLSQLELRGGIVRSANPMLQLDFGAVAKGVALDEALATLAAHGVDDALLNLGGNLSAVGRGAQGPWTVGIRSPDGDGLVASLQTTGREAVVTSGLYERVRLLDGRPVGHILDPASAAPAPGFASVTVVHPSAALADVAATALLVAGPARWQRVAERLGVAQALLIDADGRTMVTPRLAARLQAAAAHWRRALAAGIA